MFKAFLVIAAAPHPMAAHSQIHQLTGNTTFGSSGSSASTIGNPTFINHPHHPLSTRPSPQNAPRPDSRRTTLSRTSEGDSSWPWATRWAASFNRTQSVTQGASSMTFMVLEGLLLVVALTITFKAYSSNTA